MPLDRARRGRMFDARSFSCAIPCSFVASFLWRLAGSEKSAIAVTYYLRASCDWSRRACLQGFPAFPKSERNGLTRSRLSPIIITDWITNKLCEGIPPSPCFSRAAALTGIPEAAAETSEVSSCSLWHLCILHGSLTCNGCAFPGATSCDWGFYPVKSLGRLWSLPVNVVDTHPRGGRCQRPFLSRPMSVAARSG